MDRLVSLLEFLIALVLIYAGVVVGLTEETFRSNNALASLLVGENALFFWGVLFICAGVSLIYSKVTKQVKLQLHTLMLIYLMGFAILLADFLYLGISWSLLDDIILVLLAGWLWYRLKARVFYEPSAPSRWNFLTRRSG